MNKRNKLFMKKQCLRFEIFIMFSTKKLKKNTTICYIFKIKINALNYAKSENTL